jgi:hypothetical protein
MGYTVCITFNVFNDLDTFNYHYIFYYILYNRERERVRVRARGAFVSSEFRKTKLNVKYKSI